MANFDDYTYSAPAQRRWMWAYHPDVAKSMETKEITPNMAVDIINARIGNPTHYSLADKLIPQKAASSLTDYERGYIIAKAQYDAVKSASVAAGTEMVPYKPAAVATIPKPGGALVPHVATSMVPHNPVSVPHSVMPESGIKATGGIGKALWNGFKGLGTVGKVGVGVGIGAAAVAGFGHDKMKDVYN